MTQANPETEQEQLKPGIWLWVLLVIGAGLLVMGIVEFAATFRLGI